MKTNNDGGPAFPQTVSHSPLGDREFPGEYGLGGMSLRDWFAGQALVGIYAGCLFFESADAAKDAYKTADAMLKERDKGNDSAS